MDGTFTFTHQTKTKQILSHISTFSWIKKSLLDAVERDQEKIMADVTDNLCDAAMDLDAAELEMWHIDCYLKNIDSKNRVWSLDMVVYPIIIVCFCR